MKRWGEGRTHGDSPVMLEVGCLWWDRFGFPTYRFRFATYRFRFPHQLLSKTLAAASPPAAGFLFLLCKVCCAVGSAISPPPHLLPFPDLSTETHRTPRKPQVLPALSFFPLSSTPTPSWTPPTPSRSPVRVGSLYVILSMLSPVYMWRRTQTPTQTRACLPTHSTSLLAPFPCFFAPLPFSHIAILIHLTRIECVE